jgi:hypothetical protein
MLITAPVSAQSRNDALPCLDSTPSCLEELSRTALRHDPRVKVLDEAIRLQKVKGWTSYLAVDSFNLLSMAFRTARNVAGGGDRAAQKLTVDQLKLRRGEIAQQIRQDLLLHTLNYEAAQRSRELFTAKLQTHLITVQVVELAYRQGDGDTAAMLSLWDRTAELKAQLQQAEDDARKEREAITLICFADAANSSTPKAPYHSQTPLAATLSSPQQK